MEKAYDSNNVFSKIINKEIEANVIYEDDAVLAFHDINPLARFHALVVPKKTGYSCYDSFLSTADDAEIATFFKTVREIASKFCGGDGSYRIMTNSGLTAGQTVFHFHVHILGF